MENIRETNNKVLAFPVSRVHRLGPANPPAASFLAKVLPIFKAQTGLDYMRVKEILHGDKRGFMEFINEAVDQSTTPADFVQFTVASNGLKTFDEITPSQEIIDYNEAKIVVFEFANETGQEWKRDLDGRVSKVIEAADGTPIAKAFLTPVLHLKTREVGFAIQVYERDLSKASEEEFTLQDTPSKRFAGYDLEDAYNPFEAYYLAFEDTKVAFLR